MIYHPWESMNYPGTTPCITKEHRLLPPQSEKSDESSGCAARLLTHSSETRSRVVSLCQISVRLPRKSLPVPFTRSSLLASS
ncbi:unnamed protein product [Cercopithifilaria johnstoni]|uniref:Uncharacterized protein n=1 Tax=Cercopithifilaria johnstoni TaxID=2874296 RepID=A0A8J2MQF4_9BILA|nr:unnamed protein product [Cercopithifilaria johnstoni]